MNAIETAKAAWNARADQQNQWDELGCDEKLELVAKQAHRQALHHAFNAIRAERLEDPTNDDSDVAYEGAIADCERAIGALMADESAKQKEALPGMTLSDGGKQRPAFDLLVLDEGEAFEAWLESDERKDGCRGLSRLERDQMRDAWMGRAALVARAADAKIIAQGARAALLQLKTGLQTCIATAAQRGDSFDADYMVEHLKALESVIAGEHRSMDIARTMWAVKNKDREIGEEGVNQHLREAFDDGFRAGLSASPSAAPGPECETCSDDGGRCGAGGYSSACRHVAPEKVALPKNLLRLNGNLRLKVEKLASLLTKTEETKRDIVGDDGEQVTGVRIGWGAWALLRATMTHVIELKCEFDEALAAAAPEPSSDSGAALMCTATGVGVANSANAAAALSAQATMLSVDTETLANLAKLQWSDLSSADPIEKARRVLTHLIEPNAVFFHDDGFPRSSLSRQASCVLAVLDALSPRAAVSGWPNDPTATGVGNYCQPGDRKDPRWLLMFEDADRGFCYWETEAEAREKFAQAEARGWNCWLFSPTPRVPAPDVRVSADRVHVHNSTVEIKCRTLYHAVKLAAQLVEGSQALAGPEVVGNQLWGAVDARTE